jgi:diguanylate cyclase (GGDEF)-like protein
LTLARSVDERQHIAAFAAARCVSAPRARGGGAHPEQVKLHAFSGKAETRIRLSAWNTRCPSPRCLKPARAAVEVGGMSQGTSWLCPTELDRTRVVDANDRVRMIRLVGSGAVGAALLIAAPWIGWWTLGLFALSALNFLNVDRRLRTSAHPERVSATAIVITLVLLGGGVAISGGPTSPALPWLVLPAAMAAARFRPQVMAAAIALTVFLILVVTLAVHPTATIADPVPVISAFALLAGVVSIVWALQAAELHHRDEAILDPLTGLLNRHALAPRFVELSHQARLTHQPICMLLCDVDSFKSINDRYGHDRGDAVLRDIAYELRKRLRSFELVYRLGGEEFLIVLPGVTHIEGQEIAERLRAAVAETNPTGIAVTISVGLSTGADESLVYETLFKSADRALYDAKHAGRNRVVAAPAPAPSSVSAPRAPADVAAPVATDAPAILATPGTAELAAAAVSLAG